jgi:diacylglycerol kinase (ATP)
VRLRGDFGEIEQEVLQVSIANTRSYGGGLQIAPGADPTDGLFEVVIIDNVPRWTILSVLPRLFTGQHIAHPAVRVERTANIEIYTEHKRVVHADGEHLGESPLSIEICPKALNIILPPV